MQLTTPEEVEEYFKALSGASNIPKTFNSITPLSGGTANYVYRLVPASPSSIGSSLILKHAAPYVKDHPQIQFPVARLEFESTALEALSKILPQPDSEIGQHVYLPIVYHHDTESSVLISSDVGARTLKAAYADPGLDIHAIGTRLGNWLADLHALTPTLSTKEEAVVKDNVIAKSIYRYSYNHLAESLEEYGVPGGKELADSINSTYGAMLATDDEVVCHGDFWPGNILLPPADSTDENVPLGVVDWELNRRGIGATDVGQFAAEAWLLDRFHGGRGLLPAFLEAYIERAKGATSSWSGGKNMSWVNTKFRQRVLIHYGTHLGYWPSRVSWASKEQTSTVIHFGAEVLRRAVDEDWNWFQEGDGSSLTDFWR